MIIELDDDIWKYRIYIKNDGSYELYGKFFIDKKNVKCCHINNYTDHEVVWDYIDETNNGVYVFLKDEKLAIEFLTYIGKI